MSSKSKADRLAALAELKKARQGGGRTLKDTNTDIYDEVSEQDYKLIVRGRLQEDDFIEDDGPSGYVDNGMEEDWNDGRDDESEEEVERSRKPKKAKKVDKSRIKAKSTVEREEREPEQAAVTMNAYRPSKTVEQEDDFMANLLGGMDAAPAPSYSSRKRKPSPSRYSSPSPPPPRRHHGNGYSKHREPSYVDLSSDGPPEDNYPTSDDGHIFSSPYKKPKIEDDGITPHTTSKLARLDVNSAASSDFDDIDMDSFNDIDDIDMDEIGAAKPAVKAEPVEFKITRKPAAPAAPVAAVAAVKTEIDTKPAWLSVYDSLAANVKDEPLDTVGSSNGSSEKRAGDFDVLEPDGSLRFFWLDYLEHDGNVYFIGKVLSHSPSSPTQTSPPQWISCCITVTNIQRNLYVLPRRLKVEDYDEDIETDIVPTKEVIMYDFEELRKQYKVKKGWRGKFVKRKCVFGQTKEERDEREYLKVVYGFDDPQIPMDTRSPNIEKIFGTNTSAFEMLVLKRKIMGPCWLQVKDPQVEFKGVSWCKFEATVTDPKDINPLPEDIPDAPKGMPPNLYKDLPLLTTASVCVRTIVNHKENKREIVCATVRIWRTMSIDDPTPPEKLPCSVHTFVRPLAGQFPGGFERDATDKRKGAATITPVKNERMLLTSLLMTIHKSDPDVLVGHSFLANDLDTLLLRMKELKVEHWSRVGRFRRAKWPPNLGKQGGSMAAHLRLLGGRLICDLASDGAKSMIASTTWSLTEMVRTHLNHERQDIDPEDTASYFDGTVSTPEKLMVYVRHCELDAHYSMAIASKVQMLALTRVLTNLAGNAWNKTLNGGRAERNEYILLHEFHRLKYISPDKVFGSKAIARAEAEGDDQDGGTTKKKDKYKGGLVFEPKRGLYDKFILVMDFNSLYPSIIQEWNIDFTTVESTVEYDENKEEKIPEPPSNEVPQGVLPRLIATLVSRRRAVKSLMKDKSATPAQLLQYDIKQMALKLTANSMYGCLGFEYSRFYARPLAALTTFKGREILTHTRELAESKELDVIYGDTDSVFVNSGVTELSEALKISADFKKVVNDSYKLLEIDLDGIFQRLLLLQKKKYAALKVEDGTKSKTEVKGLDMKRREYCVLSKNVSQYVLEQVLSGESTEVAVENIHEYLRSVGENVRAGKVPVEDFIIFKRLGKAPEDYPDGKSQPHVQVALRMKARGGTPRAGDVIPYIFCLEGGEEPSKASQAERAKHPDELRKAGESMKIDFDYYLSNQILPPIERLCDPIEGTERARLAECLGLDPARYRSSTGGSEENTFVSFNTQKPDSERYRDCKPFLVSCKCGAQVAFEPLYTRNAGILKADGPSCLACKEPISLGRLVTQLEIQIRGYINKYYEGWTKCSDSQCETRTRMMGVYGKRCVVCQNPVSYEFSDDELYTQLCYFRHLFDGEHAAAVAGADASGVRGVVLNNIPLLEALRNGVDKYLNQSATKFVDLTSLFSFVKV